MVVNTRALAMAAAGLAVVAVGGTLWRVVEQAPAPEEPASTRVSGTVSRPAAPTGELAMDPPGAGPAAASGSTISAGRITGPAPSPPVTSMSPASSPVRPAPVPVSPPAPAPSPAPSPAPAPAPAAKSPPPPAATPAPKAPAVARPATPPAAAGIKHRVEPPPALQALLPNEVDAAVRKTLGRKPGKFFYMGALARPFVSTVDNLGNKPAPTSQWLARPAPGPFLVVKERKHPDLPLMAYANSRRHTAFVEWVMGTDSTRLVALYARMYPLLQQTYVELGHPDGYFNDRLIEVIDLMLATPAPKPPLAVQPADKAKASADATTAKPRYEFQDPALESLATGQKIMLRVGPQHAERLKAKLRELRKGLVGLAPKPDRP